MTPLQAARLRFALWLVLALAGIAVFAASCRHVDDGRDAMCLRVLFGKGICIEWREP